MDFRSFNFTYKQCVNNKCPQPGVEPVSPALEAQNLNHCTTREITWVFKIYRFYNCKRRCLTPPTVREITNKNSNKIPFLTQLTVRQSHTPPILLQEGVSKYILCLHMYKSFSRICTEKWNCWNESRLSSNCTRYCKVTCQCTPLPAVGEHSCFHTFSPSLDAIRLFHLCQSAGWEMVSCYCFYLLFLWQLVGSCIFSYNY